MSSQPQSATPVGLEWVSV